ncbi:ATPase, P-type (transporting), HAD superfamily, subfamily IC [Anaeromyxobacter sp. K]|uniref:cation-translocating P-type ATPase n=1 Tax=Anaeromyxobacter sp. (strain K) TaxID=447217 RepID=UPI00015F9F72|nr:cation-translocating P-type ATPase [Anaeromyxobacter sp. K]ACG71740.1 ATPase, P-type (transporting), HAD superfamily, subfamily IC [Anaeromyxobacter sp. K]
MANVPEWHALSADEALARLGSGPDGLDPAEAARRLAEHGPNELARGRRAPWIALLAAQFKNVLVVILMVAIALSLFLGHDLEALTIGAILAFTVVLGFVQEHRAENALAALRQMAAPHATVIRGGAERRVPARELVPGDLLLVHAGDRIPADARVIEAVNLQADEAALTGESVPVPKVAGPLPAGPIPVGDRTDMLFGGTAATYGRGRAVVVATGASTELGAIARMLAEVKPARTPLQLELDRVGTQLARAAGVVVVLLAGLGLLRGQPFLEMVVFAIALAVAVVPEALPAVVTIALALGVQRLARRNALVRRLAAAETLGSTTVICSDKTGTLTRDEMTVRALHVDGRTLEVTGSGYRVEGDFRHDGAPVDSPPALLALLAGAVLASDAKVERTPSGELTVSGDPTEAALVVAALKAGLDRAELDARAPRVGEIPFTSELKRMTTLHRTEHGRVAFVKGAPEVLLPACARVASGEGERPLDEAGRAALAEVVRGMAERALRVLAVARREGVSLAESDRDLTLLGLVGMIDPPRPEARAALERCAAAGVRVVMITGDHPVTARAIAAELGLLRTGAVVTGPELARLSDAELAGRVQALEVYARVSPADKLRIVTALQSRGEVVAMTGDGVNDAPALKKADIGVAMGITGTDVTREAAAMTLTDDNFASIVGAVEEGRAIFANVKKYLMYLLSSNVGEIGLMAAATLLGLPLPLTAVQILYVNLATDGLPALALAVDPPDADLMRQPPRDPRAGIFTRPVVALIATGGAWSTAVNLGLFAWARASGRGDAEAMTMCFMSLVLVQFAKAFAFRSERHSVLRRPFANRWLDLAIAWELALLLLVVYLPPLRAAFGTYALPAADWLLVTGAALTVLPVLELAKLAVRRATPSA